MGIVIQEIKAYCKFPESVETYLKNRTAVFKGEDIQTDTYFNCHEGRLKLREGLIENNLIRYHRSELKDVKKSQVALYQPGENVADLKAILTETLGIKVVVKKRRKIFFIDNVKFHIDYVDCLGSFVEIEAIGEEGEEKKLGAQCRFFMDELQITKDQLIDQSYSDMLITKS